MKAKLKEGSKVVISDGTVFSTEDGVYQNWESHNFKITINGAARQTAGPILVVKKAYSNRNCILIGKGYGDDARYGRGPVSVSDEFIKVIK